MSTEQTASAASIVRALLTRHGVGPRQHSIEVAKALELSRPAAHQRVQGATSWPWDDVVRLATLYGETLLDLVLHEAGLIEARLLAGQEIRLVRVRLGDSQPDVSDPWAARHLPGGQIEIIPNTPANQSQNYTFLKVLLLIYEDRARPLRVAVLDDSSDTAVSVANRLRTKGCDATPYTAGKDLLDALRRVPAYDAYVIDWVLSNGTAESVIAEIRLLAPQARIILLTGELGQGGKADEDEIVQAQARYQFTICQKPASATRLMVDLMLDVTVRAAVIQTEV
jgi:ActR/RegA family two-component response regulator